LRLFIDINSVLLDFNTRENRLSDGCMDVNERARLPLAGRELDHRGLENCGVRRRLRRTPWIARWEEPREGNLPINGGKAIGTKGKCHNKLESQELMHRIF
jgi:hypothetical protein